MPENPNKRRMGRRQVIPLVWGLSIMSLVVLALGITGTLSGFTATIDNNANSAGTGSVVMVETSGATTCYSNGATSGSAISTNSNTCAINKLGGNLLMLPGTTSTVNVTIQNAGTSPVGSAFTLTPAGCSTATNGSPAGADTAGFCGKVDVAIWDTTDSQCVVGAAGASTSGNCVPSTAGSPTLSSLGTSAVDLLTPAGGSVAAGASKTYRIETMIDSSATNADQALKVSDDLTWTFSA